MPNFAGTPAGIKIEVLADESPETWIDISGPVDRESLTVVWSGDAFTTELNCNAQREGGGYPWLTEERRIRAFDPYTSPLVAWPRYFYGTIKRVTDYADGTNQKWSLQALGPHLALTEDSAQITNRIEYAAGAYTDKQIIQDLFATYAPDIDTSAVNTIITSMPLMVFENMNLQEALDEIRKQAGTSTFPDWQGHATVTVGTLRQPTGSNLTGHFYQAIVGGTTNASEPPWPTTRGGTVVDSGVTWQEMGLSSQKPSYYVTWAPDNNAHTALWTLKLQWFDEASDVQVPVISTILADVQVEDATHKRYGKHSRNRDSYTLCNVKTVKGYNGAAYTADGRISTPPTPIDVAGEPSTDRLLAALHGFANGQLLYLSTTGTLPAPLVPGRAYYTKEVTTNTLRLSQSAGGATIDITDVGSGTHSATAPNGYYKPARDSYLAYRSRAKFGKTIVHTEPEWDTERCKMLAEAYTRTLGQGRQTLQAETRAQITQYLLTGPRKVRFTHTLLGLNESPEYINKATLSFPNKRAQYALELGTRMRQMGDNELIGVVGGDGYGGNTAAPNQPTWASGGAWILDNYYDVSTGKVVVQVQCQLSPIPADLYRYLWTWSVGDRQFSHFTDRSEPQITVSDLLPDETVTWVVEAHDTSGNRSVPSASRTLQTVEATPSALVYNGGFEAGNPYYIPPDVLRADGWKPSTGGGGVASRDNTYSHGSSGWSSMLDSSSGLSGTFAKVLSRYMLAQAGVRHRIALWCKSAFAGNYLTVKVYWYDSSLTLLGGAPVVLVSNAAVDSTWRQFPFTPIAPATTYALKVEASNLVGGSHAIWVDDWDVVVNPPTSTFYNGSMEIPNPQNNTLPDGYTFEGNALPALSSTNVVDGNLSLRITQTAGSGQTLITRSTPRMVLAGRSYRFNYSWMRSAQHTLGTDYALVWRDNTNAVVATTSVSKESGGLTGHFINRSLGPYIAPAGATTATLTITSNASDASYTISTNIDAIDIVDVGTEAGQAPDASGWTVTTANTSTYEPEANSSDPYGGVAALQLQTGASQIAEVQSSFIPVQGGSTHVAGSANKLATGTLAGSVAAHFIDWYDGASTPVLLSSSTIYNAVSNSAWPTDGSYTRTKVTAPASAKQFRHRLKNGAGSRTVLFSAVQWDSEIKSVDIGAGQLSGPEFAPIVSFTNQQLNITGTAKISSDNAIAVKEIGTPATPATGVVVMYPKADKRIYGKGSDGVEFAVGFGAPQFKSTNFTLDNVDSVYICTNGLIATLPTAVGCAGRIYYIANISTIAVAIGTTSGQLVNGVPGAALGQQYSGVFLISDGANWLLMTISSVTDYLNVNTITAIGTVIGANLQATGQVIGDQMLAGTSVDSPLYISSGNSGWSGTFMDQTGLTVTVTGGIITDVR